MQYKQIAVSVCYALTKLYQRMTKQIHSYFMFCPQVMRHPEKVKRNQIQKKRSVKICFPKQENNEETGAEGNVVKKPVQMEPMLVNETAFGSPKTHHFEDAVCQLAQLCLVHVNEGKSERHLVFLSLLLRSFHTPRVFSVSCFCF